MVRAVAVDFSQARELIKKARERGDVSAEQEQEATGAANKEKHRRNKATSERNTAALIEQCRALGCPEPTREHLFRADRMWRFDLCWEDFGVAAEIEGGTFSGGRHNRAGGFAADAEKYNTAACMSWVVIRIPTTMIKSGHGAAYIAEALRVSGCAGIARQTFHWED